MLTTCNIFKKPLLPYDVSKEVKYDDFKIFVYIPICELHPNQLGICNNIIKAKNKNKRLYTTPYVVLKGDKLILLDGHHTIIAKMKKGIKKVKCLFHAIK